MPNETAEPQAGETFSRLKWGALGALLLVGVGFLIADGITENYEIAMVNGTEIPYSDYRSFRESFESYRNTLVRSGNNSSAAKALQDLSSAEVDRLTLEQMIQQYILHEHLMQEFGLRAEDMIRAGLAKARSGGEVTARDLGTPASTFERLVLIPQIERAVASELVRDRGGDFSEWLEGHLASAVVSVRWYNYNWENGTLKSK